MTCSITFDGRDIVIPLQVLDCSGCPIRPLEEDSQDDEDSDFESPESEVYESDDGQPAFTALLLPIGPVTHSPENLSFLTPPDQISEDLNHLCHLELSQRESLKDVVLRHCYLFVSNCSELLGDLPSPPIKIDTGDAPPISSRPFRETREETVILQEEVEKMLKEGIIVPVSSPWASPVVLTQKADGSWRFSVEYRKLNAVIKWDKFPLPLIETCFAGSRYFSSFDMLAGYWQMLIDKDSQEKTAFIVSFGTFYFRVLPFGLTNSSSVFARFIAQVFAPFLYKFVVAYLDDLTVYAESFEKHLRRVNTDTS